jgi:hypothetical protein
MSKKIPKYPEEFADGSLRWMHLAKSVTSGLSDAWFSQYQALPIREALAPSLTDYDQPGIDALNSTLVPGNDYKVIPDFASSLKDRGFTPVAFVMSDLGQSILATMDKANLSYQRRTKILVDDSKYLEFPPETSLAADLYWSTYFNNAFTQTVEIVKDSAGKEYCYWSSTILYGSRGQGDFDLFDMLSDANDLSSNIPVDLTDDEKNRGVMNFGEWSTKICLPWLSKCLFYLGETPFPSSLASMSRSLAFPGLDETKIPIPYMQFVKNYEVQCHYEQATDDNKSESRNMTFLAPQQIQMGWLFSASDFESQKIILTTITNALVKIMSYLEDGYLNHNTPGEPFQFDEVVFSDSQLERRFANDGNAGGYSKWIPTTQVMERILETDARAQALYGSLRSELGKKNDRMWIVDEGVGKAAVGSAINDSIFRYFLPEEQWGGVEWYALRAIEMEIHNETTNAISNWGLSKYLQGDYEFAILLFTRALDREDKFAEDESSFYLSKIYEKQGDRVKSEEYRKRCEAAGGYEPTYL